MYYVYFQTTGFVSWDKSYYDVQKDDKYNLHKLKDWSLAGSTVYNESNSDLQ